MQALIDAIKNKITDSTVFNDVGGRVYFDMADTNEYPRIVYRIISAVPEKTFTESFQDILIQFDLFSAKSAAPTEITTMYKDLHTLLDECRLTITGDTLLRMYETNLVTLSEDLDEPLPDGSSGLSHWAVDYEVLIENG